MTQSDGVDGAARAASRLHNCFLQSGIDVTMLVGSKSSKNESVLKIPVFLKVLAATYSRLDFKLCRWLLPDSKQWKTSGMFGVISARALNKSSFDAINIHWIGHGLISLNQLARIKKKVIWTIHDEWVLEGISHYKEELIDNRGVIKAKVFKILINYTNRKKLHIFNNSNLEIVSVSSDIKVKLMEKYPQIKSRIHVISNPLEAFSPDSQIKPYHSNRFIFGW